MVLLGALALTACGEGAAPLTTTTPSPARVVSTIGPAPTATTAMAISLPVPTPETMPETTEVASPVTVTFAPASPASPAPNVAVTGVATVRTAPQPTVAGVTGATPTPLAFGIATAARATVAAGTARATAAPSTAITGSTSGSVVAGAGTSASGTVIALTTRPVGTGTASGGTVSATPASTTTRTAGTMAAMATEMAPAVRAQTTVVNFLNVVLRNGDLSSFLAPGLRGQDGAQVLGIMGNIRTFVVTGERPDTDGTGMVVSATITTASGTVMKQLHMTRSGNAWVIDRVA